MALKPENALKRAEELIGVCDCVNLDFDVSLKPVRSLSGFLSLGCLESKEARQSM